MTSKLKIILSIIFAVICSVAVGVFAACGGLIPDGGDDGNGGGGDCEHSLIYHVAVAPLCEEEGNSEYWQCENCHLYFSDSQAKTETTLEDVALAALGHDLVGTVCEGLTCSRGDYEVDGVGHDLADAEWQYADDLHMIDDHCTYEGTRSTVCEVCNKPITESYRLKNNHTYITEIGRQATCTTEGTIVTKCTVCGDIIATRNYSDELAHDWNDGERQGSVTVYTCNHNSNHTKRVIVADEGAAEATFTKDALADVDEISVSNAAISFDSAAMESLPADEEVKLSVEIADNNQIDTAIREKITNDLYDINLTASSGGITSFGGGKAKISLPYTLKEGEDLDTIVVWYLNGSTLEPIESTYSNGYVIFETTHFSLYTVGNYTAEEACAALGHNQVSRRTEPTCTEDGALEVFCTRCGEVFSTTVFPALGHDWQLDNTHEATCTEDGEEVYVCSVCGEKRSEKIPALGHDYQKQIIPPTCTDRGYTVYTCTRCGNTYNDDYTQALGHEWNISEPTCVQGQVCIRCDALGAPATGNHNYEDGKCTVCGQLDGAHRWSIVERLAPTCSQYGYEHYVCTDDDCNEEYILIADPHGHVYEQPDMDGPSDRCIYCNEPVPEDNVIVLESLVQRNNSTYVVGIWERTAVGEVTLTFSLVFYANGEEVLVPLNLTSADYSIEYPISLEMLESRAPAYVLTVTNENLVWNEMDSASQTLGNSCYVGMQVTVTAENVAVSALLDMIGIINKHELHYSKELSIPYEEVGCGELYSDVYVCKICGYIDEEIKVREHTYQEIPELAPGSLTCFDGVIYKDTCTACGEVRGERRDDTPKSHAGVEVTYKFETPCGIKTLTQFVCVCGGFKEHVYGLYDRNNGCYYSRQSEEYDNDGHKIERYLCLECGSTMVVESYNLEEGCNRESYIFYYFYTAENEEMTDPINYYYSYKRHTFEEEVLESTAYNFETDGYGGDRMHTQYHCTVCGFEYYVISEYRDDEYGRMIYSYYETTVNGYVEWRKMETTYGEHCVPTEWEWTDECPEGRPIDAPDIIGGDGGSHVYTDEKYANATCTQYGGYWYECVVCGYSNINPLFEYSRHEFHNGMCIQCGALQTEQGDTWNIILEHLTVDEFNNSDYTYIGMFVEGVSVENISFTFTLVYLDADGKEIPVPFTFDAALKTRAFYPTENSKLHVAGSYYLEIPNALVDAEKALTDYQNYLGLRVTATNGHIQSVLTATDHRHQYASGVCSICGYHCTHIYYKDSPICVACGVECTHENHDIYGWCNECHREVNHNFNNGVCGDCGYVCNHHQMDTMKDDQGRAYYVCDLCGMECYHDGGWGNVHGEGTCDFCGAYCCHYYYETGDSAFNSEYVCAICGLHCEHKTHNREGKCTVCGKEVGHTWDGGECTECEYTCPHDFDVNTCTICGLYCEHEWDSQNGVCLICGHYCRHDMNDGLCSVCGFRCDHVDETGNSTFAAGCCYVCGQECEHVWTYNEWGHAGYCTICWLPCEHYGNYGQFKDGVCQICEWECTHPDGWANGCCQICGTTCEHNWVYPPEDRFPEMDIGSFCEKCGLWCNHRDNSGNSLIDENDNCTVCQYHCEHEWQDGRCIYCGNQCKHKDAHYCYCPTCGSTLNQHLYDATGKCYECGKVCEHKFNRDVDISVCANCGYVCSHEEYSYEYYIDRWTGEHITNPDPMFGHYCLTCGFDAGQFAHRYKNGVCTDCGYECSHPYGLWDLDGDGIDEYCDECHYGCSHENHSEDGNCYICGTHVEHNFNNDNTCAVCGFHCGHTQHNYAGACTVCGEHVGHNFENNCGNIVCTECGYVCRHIMEDFANGDNCSICGQSCPHYFDDNSLCRVCGYECEHEWNGYGMCNICRNVCKHPDHNTDGICSVCHGIAPHGPYTNGVCDVCGFECGHDFLPNGLCRICQTECEHEYNSYGYCDICGHAEDGHGHEFDENGNGVCDICGYVCRHPHYNEYGYCLDCHKECEHSWEYDFEKSHSSHCSICGKWCYHSPYDEKWNDATCTECGWTCTHDYLYNYSEEYHFCNICGHSGAHEFDTNGYCTECGYYCEHSSGFKDGKCSKCGWECTHEWQSYDNGQHYCSICQSYETHTFTGIGWDRYCTECGHFCEHSFNNDVCKNCGWECTHEWAYNTDGDHYCAICQKVEEHSFENGKCTVCNWQCPHYNEDENGSCVICGLKCNHEWEPIEGSYRNHRCTICGRVGNHNYNASGECTLCHFECDHPEGFFISGGECGYCGMECPHNWQSNGSDYDHYCTVCELHREHTYNQNGYCTECGWQCNHSWGIESYCYICKKQCDHEWSSSYADIEAHTCTICNYRESHKYDNGTCVYCDWECNHPNGLNESICDICGWVCPHAEWEYETVSGHICTTCRIAEIHSFDQNGYCATCDWQCDHSNGSWQCHNYGEHICLICQKVEAHSFDKNGYCASCDWQCEHISGFNNSKCEICGFECQHEWFNDGVCDECGWHCPHDVWSYSADSEHMCARCFKVQSHSFDENGHCSTCDWQCHHEWYSFDESHYCNICRIVEKHNFDSNGYCSTCYYQCYHMYFDENGLCGNCGWQCPHNYNSMNEGNNEYTHRCSICQRDEKHNWDSNGHCDVCDYRCDHQGNLLHCDICGYDCPHEWSAFDSEHHICQLCYYSEPHNYVSVDGRMRCTVCNKYCSHAVAGGYAYFDGVCMFCGTECDHSKGWEFLNNDYQNHYCKMCYATQSHDWNNGGCFGCNYGCMHENGFIDGKCVNCGWVCDHSFWVMPNDEYTHVCGYCEQHVEHEFDGVGNCFRCMWQCKHEYGYKEDGSCSICGWIHYHEWRNEGNEYAHCCLMCQWEEKHNWDSNGYCSTCEWWCGHGFGFDESGACSICGYKCNHTGGWMQFDEDYHQCEMCGTCFPHNWDKMGTCTDCQTPCNHIWKGGDDYNHHCLRCGVNEPHMFNWEGYCEMCGAECLHDWFSDPYMHTCNLCQRNEPHSFDWQGHCSICGYQCEHLNMDEGGWCPDCGQSNIL